jgi:hypothetical protein
MMKTLMFILLIPVLLFGQENKTLPQNGFEASTNFELGIRDDFIIMHGRYFNRDEVSSGIPFNLHLAAGVRFLKHYKADLRFGFNVPSGGDFEGSDAGIYLLADLFNTDLFATSGIDFFSVGSISHGSASNAGGSLITFYCFGIGYNTSENFELDIIYYVPDHKTYGQDASWGPNAETIYRTVNGLFRIGFQYSFIF